MPFLDISMERTRKAFETNLFGPMRLVQLLSPALIEARGLIINVSSASARVPYLFGSIYSSSKGALDTWTHALRMELQPFHVRVMLSVTGTVHSETVLKGELPKGSLYQEVEDVYQWRLAYSQNSSKTGTMPQEEFARRLVNEAMKGEGWLGGWFGATGREFWCGGMTAKVWIITTLLPRSLLEWLTANHFNVPAMTKRIQEARAKQA